MEILEYLYYKYHEIIYYGIFGVMTTAVNILLFYFLKNILLIPYLLSNFISIVISIFVSYLSNKNLVFKSKTSSKKEMLGEFVSFVGLRSISGTFDMIIMYLLIDILKINSNVSKVLTQAIVALLNFMFSKFFIFKKK